MPSPGCSTASKRAPSTNCTEDCVGLRLDWATYPAAQSLSYLSPISLWHKPNFSAWWSDTFQDIYQFTRAADSQLLTALHAAIPVWQAAGTLHFQLGSAVSPLPTAEVHTAQVFPAVTRHQTPASLGFAVTASWMLVACMHNAQLM